jgi:hypothetical protein
MRFCLWGDLLPSLWEICFALLGSLVVGPWWPYQRQDLDERCLDGILDVNVACGRSEGMQTSQTFDGGSTIGGHVFVFGYGKFYVLGTEHPFSFGV